MLSCECELELRGAGAGRWPGTGGPVRWSGRASDSDRTVIGVGCRHVACTTCELCVVTRAVVGRARALDSKGAIAPHKHLGRFKNEKFSTEIAKPRMSRVLHAAGRVKTTLRIRVCAAASTSNATLRVVRLGNEHLAEKAHPREEDDHDVDRVEHCGRAQRERCEGRETSKSRLWTQGEPFLMLLLSPGHGCCLGHV